MAKEDAMAPANRSKSRTFGRLWPLLLLPLALARGAEAYENPLFAYTHLLPSPFTLPGGRLMLGTEIAYGVTDFLQVGSSLIHDVYQVYNADIKLSFLDFEEFAAALTLQYEWFNFHDFSSRNPDLSVSAWMPGIVVGYAIGPQLAHFVGLRLNFASQTLNTDGLVVTGYATGAEAESDLSWNYNPKKKSLGNALSGGVSYDITYKLLGFGVSHHWPGFHLGFHYYPNASDYKLQPILVGGASIDLK
jgi:hypothetical protein